MSKQKKRLWALFLFPFSRNEGFGLECRGMRFPLRGNGVIVIRYHAAV